MAIQHKDGSIIAHRWEAAKLGIAPFTFLGCDENVFDNGDGTTKGGGTCDYCGAGIRNCFHVQSACGKKFVVGCDCIAHLNDPALVVVVESAIRKMNREKSRQRKIKNDIKMRAQLAAMQPEWDEALKACDSKPHPNSYFAGQGKTYGDYFRYFIRCPLAQHFNPKEALRRANEAITAAKNLTRED